MPQLTSLNARLGSTEAYDKFLMIQGESLEFLAIVEGLFAAAIPTAITIEVVDTNGENKATITDGDITRVTQEVDLQVFRFTLTTIQSSLLASGLAKIEFSVDNQKAILTHALEIIKQI